jgi:hypothetical protein
MVAALEDNAFVEGGKTIPFDVYVQYINFAWDEELERMSDWVHARLHLDNWSPNGHKFWVGLHVNEIGLPSLEEITHLVKNRNIVVDLAIIKSNVYERNAVQQRLYEELRCLYYDL